MPYKIRSVQRKYQAKWNRERRAAWVKKNGPCTKCGSADRLEVDHRDPAKKVSHRIWSWSKTRREAELRKCQVLCHSCHRKKSASRGEGTYRLSLAQVKSIRAEIKAGTATKRAIAKKYKISYRYLHYLKNGEYRTAW